MATNFTTPIATMGSSLTVGGTDVPVKDFPDFGTDVDTIDMTSLYDFDEVSITGLRRGSNMAFTANYDPTVFTTLKGFETAKEAKACVFTFNDGSKYTFDALVSVGHPGKGVSEGVDMTVTLNRTTALTWVAPPAGGDG